MHVCHICRCPHAINALDLPHLLPGLHLLLRCHRDLRPTNCNALLLGNGPASMGPMLLDLCQGQVCSLQALLQLLEGVYLSIPGVETALIGILSCALDSGTTPLLSLQTVDGTLCKLERSSLWQHQPITFLHPTCTVEDFEDAWGRQNAGHLGLLHVQLTILPVGTLHDLPEHALGDPDALIQQAARLNLGEPGQAFVHELFVYLPLLAQGWSDLRLAIFLCSMRPLQGRRHRHGARCGGCCDKVASGLGSMRPPAHFGANGQGCRHRRCPSREPLGSG
mmetsp:Transcript_114336/g.160458  ORF Transcript_114336/g.160458 Transcript_114336/m.160458 type:complete len:279 (+) Transcript_114336:696-1532(+)